MYRVWRRLGFVHNYEIPYGHCWGSYAMAPQRNELGSLIPLRKPVNLCLSVLLLGVCFALVSEQFRFRKGIGNIVTVSNWLPLLLHVRIEFM